MNLLPTFNDFSRVNALCHTFFLPSTVTLSKKGGAWSEPVFACIYLWVLPHPSGGKKKKKRAVLGKCILIQGPDDRRRVCIKP